MPPKPASLAPSPLFKFRRITHLVVAAITELVVHGALPLMSGFEKSIWNKEIVRSQGTGWRTDDVYEIGSRCACAASFHLSNNAVNPLAVP
jgi:hypothetical protein